MAFLALHLPCFKAALHVDQCRISKPPSLWLSCKEQSTQRATGYKPTAKRPRTKATYARQTTACSYLSLIMTSVFQPASHSRFPFSFQTLRWHKGQSRGARLKMLLGAAGEQVSPHHGSMLTPSRHEAHPKLLSAPCGLGSLFSSSASSPVVAPSCPPSFASMAPALAVPEPRAACCCGESPRVPKDCGVPRRRPEPAAGPFTGPSPEAPPERRAAAFASAGSLKPASAQDRSFGARTGGFIPRAVME